MPRRTDLPHLDLADLRELGARIDHTVTGMATTAAGRVGPLIATVRKPVLAAIGAGDAVLDRVCELPAAVRSLPRPESLSSAYDALSERGEHAVGRLRAETTRRTTRIQHEPASGDAAGPAEPATEQTPPAATARAKSTRKQAARSQATRRRTSTAKRAAPRKAAGTSTRARTLES